jgi:hypothetical protein
MIKFSRTFLMLWLAVFSFHTPAAQARLPVGRLRGIVVDLSYARVANATISFECGSFKEYARTDENGAYEVELPAGHCVVRATHLGFLPRRVKLDIEAGATRTLNMILDVEQVKLPECPKGQICIYL